YGLALSKLPATSLLLDRAEQLFVSPCRALPLGIKPDLSSRRILAQHVPVLVDQRHAIGHALEDGVQLLAVRLCGLEQARVLQRHGGLGRQSRKQRLVSIRETVGLAMAEQQPAAHLAAAIEQRCPEKTANHGMAPRYANGPQAFPWHEPVREV